jgi:hypothetical protein
MTTRSVEFKAPDIAPPRAGAMPTICPGCFARAVDRGRGIRPRFACADPLCDFTVGWILVPAAHYAHLDELDGPNTIYAVPYDAAGKKAYIGRARIWPPRL